MTAPLSNLAAAARRGVAGGLSRPAIVAAGALLAVVMVAATAKAPALAVVALLPLVLVPLIFGAPAVAVAALAAALFVQRLPPLGLAATALLVLVGARWLEARWSRPAATNRDGGVAPVLTATLVGFLLWLGLSLGWARDAAAGATQLADWVVSAALFGAVVTMVRAPSHVFLVARAFIAGAVASILVGLGAVALLPGSALAQRTWFENRLQGGAGDPNLLACGLLGAIALAIGALAVSRRRSLERRLLLAALALLICGLGATQSRGGIIAGVAMALAALALGHGRRLRAALGVGAAVALLVAALAVSPGGLARVVTPDTEGDGRADLWRVAGRMVGQDPVAGVGLGNFPVRAADLVQAPGELRFAELIAERPHDVHNTYLQLFAEVGLPGLLGYLAVVGLALSTAWRAHRRFAARGERDLAMLAKAVLLGGVGMLVALVFLTEGDDMRLWVFLGLGPALLAMSGGRTERAPIIRRGRP